MKPNNKRMVFIILLVGSLLLVGCSFNPEDRDKDIIDNQEEIILIEEIRSTSAGGSTPYFLLNNDTGGDLFEVDSTGQIWLHNFENCAKINTTDAGEIQCVADEQSTGAMDYTNLALTNESEVFEQNVSIEGNVSIGTGDNAFKFYFDGTDSIINLTGGQGRIANSSNSYTLNQFLIDIDTDTTYSALSEFSNDLDFSIVANVGDADTKNRTIVEENIEANISGLSTIYADIEFAYADTNASTICGGDEVLDGDGDCVDHSSWITAETDSLSLAQFPFYINITYFDGVLTDFINKSSNQIITGIKKFSGTYTNYSNSDILFARDGYTAMGNITFNGSSLILKVS